MISQSYTLRTSPTLRIPTVQTRRAPIHDDDGVRVALVAHGGAGRKGGRVLRGALGAGAGEVFGDAAGAARARG